MKRTSPLPRLTALVLCLALLALPAAALTPDQARELLTAHYVDPVPQEVLEQTTVEDMLRVLADPYTEYMTAREYADFLATMADSAVGGIGVTTVIGDSGLEITAVSDGGPAQGAGIRPGDVIVAVNGREVADVGGDTAIAMIRGDVGQPVQVTYLRSGLRRTVTLIRATITVPSTTGSVLDGTVGYIDCDTWGEETCGHFRDLITEMDDRVTVWLVDLRDNTGGFTSAATDAAGLFCGPGTTLSLRMRDTENSGPDGYVYEFHGSDQPALTHKPVVILTNSLTASSSEVFAAALKDFGRAVTVGGRTYGKGVAQGLWDQESAPDLFPDGDALKITIARGFSPMGNTCDTIGLIPQLPTEEDEVFDVAAALAVALGGEQDWHSFFLELLSSLTEECRFADTGDCPYEAAITQLAAYELVSGKGDGLFHPDDVLTRAELAQLLTNLLAVEPRQSAKTFSDVAPTAWYADAVAVVCAMRLMEGTAPGAFSPDRVLTHQELFTVLGRLARWLNDDLDLLARRAGEEEFQLRVLQDYADWAKSSAWLLSCALDSGSGIANLMWDEPENIDPTAPATRAEAADALHSLLYYLDILP